MKILPRPFSITCILCRHQHKISQKERVNPEPKAVEILPRPSPITYILSSKKACPWRRHTAVYEVYMSKAKKSESKAAQSCPSLCDPMAYSLPDFSVYRIFQARIMEWVTISFSRRSSLPRDWTYIFRIIGRHFTIWATREVLYKAKECEKERIFTSSLKGS